ncbi:glycosyltransferase [Paraburkholderia tropica]|uniref:Glycosyltransferase involved in cell wall biosynthesis n=1 Tax=Paraburkholderia tropica TaxID=92647 RepID=A0ABX5N0M3_9BURK|nr:glycosyltransferase [Paraburkholderia tropica]MDE1142030.1 glycosyltransferase [Paraburkholderia tropica]PXX20715.1 glycosyltransferase involved in cell wall biosynthesis [Paraburkholderia tropica]PZW89793.1 glycosyltransferase involved in cell wall biosynthesis [Paraburkholderia tropica]
MENKIVSSGTSLYAQDHEARSAVRDRPVVFYVQPLIARYRVEVIESLNRLFCVKVFACSEGMEANGFSRERPDCEEFVETRIAGLSSRRIRMQSRVLTRIVLERPDAVLIFADVRYLSLWLALIAGRAIRVPVLIHGQGLYRHTHAGFVRTLCYRIAVALAQRYVCYTEASRRSLVRIGCPARKLVVANNSLQVSSTVEPSAKTGTENGVLFIGRLRENSQIEGLIEVIAQLHREGCDIALHVVGGGEHAASLQRRYRDRSDVIWYGALYDDDTIAAISRRCRVGCYPGSAGLSVVHMFALSLPPVVHNRLRQHMGPEPGYVEDGHTGFLFRRDGGVAALAATLRRAWALPPDTMREMATAAHAAYCRLNTPTLGHQLAEIVEASLRA